MTSKRAANYPGSTGVTLGPSLSLDEAASLRADLGSIAGQTANPESFYDGMEYAAVVWRAAIKLDLERLPSQRRKNLIEAIELAKADAEGAVRSLSSVNRYSFQFTTGEDMLGRFEQVIASIRSFGPGPPPDDAAISGGVMVLKHFRETYPQRPTAYKLGPFVTTLGAVAKAAGRSATAVSSSRSGRKDVSRASRAWTEDLHSLAEKLLKIELRAEAENPGLTTYTLPRKLSVN